MSPSTLRDRMKAFAIERPKPQPAKPD
jgi:hypothetical protein